MVQMPGRIIAAIFEPLEAVEQALRDVALADNPDNSAHSLLGRLSGHSLAEALAQPAMPFLLVALDRKAVGLDVPGDDRSRRRRSRPRRR